jgi:hypothetical protein
VLAHFPIVVRWLASMQIGRLQRRWMAARLEKMFHGERNDPGDWVPLPVKMKIWAECVFCASSAEVNAAAFGPGHSATVVPPASSVRVRLPHSQSPCHGNVQYSYTTSPVRVRTLFNRKEIEKTRPSPSPGRVDVPRCTVDRLSS